MTRSAATAVTAVSISLFLIACPSFHAYRLRVRAAPATTSGQAIEIERVTDGDTQKPRKIVAAVAAEHGFREFPPPELPAELHPNRIIMVFKGSGDPKRTRVEEAKVAISLSIPMEG